VADLAVRHQVAEAPGSVRLHTMLDKLEASPDDDSAELPAQLTSSEKRLAYRLKTEFGIEVEGFRGISGTPNPRSAVTLRSALNELEILQQKRDLRTHQGSNPISKTTLREALEELKVVQTGRRKIRRVRGKRVRRLLLP
jgi:hypothetical protein